MNDAVAFDPDPMLAATADELRVAVERRASVSLEGAGSRRNALRPTAAPAISSTPFRGIVAYDPGDLVVTVRCGTPLDELEAVLAQAGQMLAFEPPRRHGSTVGGAVALGWSGPRRPFSGAVRDHVTGVRLLDGRGRDLHFGGPVVKNVAGFDVPRLMTGSYGILGLLLEVSLRVIPKPRVERTCAFDCAVHDGLERMRSLRAGPGLLSAACWIDGRLLLRFSGSERSVQTQLRDCGGDALPEANSEALWRSITDQTHDFFRPHGGLRLWRVSLRFGAPFFAAATHTAIDWAGALRWVWVTPGAEAALPRWASAHGGHAMPWPPVEPVSLAPALLRVQHGIADVFDPHRIFDRGRLLTPLTSELAAA